MIGVGYGAVQALGVAGRFASGLMSASARRAEFAQELRALEMKKKFTVGRAKVLAGASGTTMDSKSTVDYLAGLTGEFDLAIQALKESRNTSGVAGLLGNLSELAGGGASTYGTLATLNNWWK